MTSPLVFVLLFCNPSSRECKHTVSAKLVQKLIVVIISYAAVRGNLARPSGFVISPVVPSVRHTSLLFPVVSTSNLKPSRVCLYLCVCLRKASRCDLTCALIIRFHACHSFSCLPPHSLCHHLLVSSLFSSFWALMGSTTETFI